MVKKKKAPNTGGPSDQPHKNGDPNFAVTAKNMYRCMQLSHHLAISRAQLEGKLTRGFQAKLRELRRFLKPACPTDKLAAELDLAHDGWVKGVTETLTHHYLEELDKYKALVKSSPLCVSDFERAKSLAIGWARRNFRTKLAASNLAEFHGICKEFTGVTTNTSGEPCPDIGDPKPTFSEVVKTPPPATPRPSQKRRLSTSPTTSPNTQVTPPSKAVKFASPGANTTPPRPSVAVHHTAESPRLRDWQTQPTSMANIKPWRAEGGEQKKDWKLPKLSASTLILGDSNLSKITKVRVAQKKDLEVCSFPGGKFQNMRVMLEQSSPQPHVKNVVLSVGINERNNNVSMTSFPQFKRFVATARTAFPEAKMYMASLDWDPKRVLPPENANLRSLHEKIQKSKLIDLLPSVDRSKFKIVPGDNSNIHWSTGTANQLLDCWLEHLN